MVVLGNDSLLEVESKSWTENMSSITYFHRCFVPDHFTNHAALRYYCLGSRVCVGPLLSVWAMVAGIINTVAFCKMGLKEGVTQNFLILSLADGLQGLVYTARNVCFLLDLFDFRFRAVS
ncbi:hypothetical protein RRG08_008347 [Elysia crispata]|uniref:Uncharacterized protein n=1 Tax=Elysia crispata TaxID=231223 RepID=A0AAE1AJM0_9GAST|nr:hypothetical protein RRG08_008347 [Elysia crispata]